MTYHLDACAPDCAVHYKTLDEALAGASEAFDAMGASFVTACVCEGLLIFPAGTSMEDRKILSTLWYKRHCGPGHGLPRCSFPRCRSNPAGQCITCKDFVCADHVADHSHLVRRFVKEAR